MSLVRGEGVLRVAGSGTSTTPESLEDADGTGFFVYVTRFPDLRFPKIGRGRWMQVIDLRWLLRLDSNQEPPD